MLFKALLSKDARGTKRMDGRNYGVLATSVIIVFQHWSVVGFRVW
jgi:hypothetical protein